MNRRTFIKTTATSAAALGLAPSSRGAAAADEALGKIKAEVAGRHDESVRRLQQWIHQASIAAENRGMAEGCELQVQLLREAGFDHAERVPTDGQPGVFATLDAGAARTIGVYLMYDVKQGEPMGWTAAPWGAGPDGQR